MEHALLIFCKKEKLSEVVLQSRLAIINQFQGAIFWFTAAGVKAPEALPSHVACANYKGDDFGQQSEYATKIVFDTTGCTRLIQIFDDTPLLNNILVSQAITELKYNSVLLGPGYMGGFYLMGSRKLLPMLYERMVWTSPRLLSEMIGRINKHVKTYFLLPPLPES
jgi:glycosyltransferase A (GT-A) superfamily protein (DUF2064 family)